MMDGYLCPGCGKMSHQLLSPKLAMGKVARDRSRTSQKPPGVEGGPGPEAVTRFGPANRGKDILLDILC